MSPFIRRWRLAAPAVAILLAASAAPAGPVPARQARPDVTGAVTGLLPSSGADAGMVAGTRTAAGKATGNRRAYAFISQRRASDPIARWNPCGGAIDYRVNLARAPRGALADVKSAMGRISRATGLSFRYRGTTNVIPGAKRGYRGTYPRDTELVIAWATPGKHSTMLPKPPKGTQASAGRANIRWTTAYARNGRRAAMITRAGVVLNSTIRLAPGFGQGPRYGWSGTSGQLLMHEIGHAVGLGHPAIRDRSQIMYPQMTRKVATWGAGDLNGLRLVGRNMGCLYR